MATSTIRRVEIARTGVNPVLIIMALAYRVSQPVVDTLVTQSSTQGTEAEQAADQP